jgi:L-lactate dehydrogenase (cytochrome)
MPDAIARKLRLHLCLDDFERSARRLLPRQIYGFYSGGAERLAGIASNDLAFAEYSLVPNVLADVSRRRTAVRLLGQEYSAPIGICPMGLAGLATFRGDLALVAGAVAESVPMVVSGAAIHPLEQLAAEGARWFQAYLPGDEEEIAAMVRRVEAAGYDHLVLTVDAPVLASRENDLRTGFTIPLKLSARLIWDGISHPRWSLGTFMRTMRHGVPRFYNMSSGGGPGLFSTAAVVDPSVRARLSWRHVDLLRGMWRGKLVIKGILSPQDAAESCDHGVDAIWLSNHGGRQLDGAIAPVEILPDVAERVAGRIPILLDGGVRRGTDVVKALALGADFIFVGRPFLYAAATAGVPGIRKAITMLRMEIDRNLALLGLTDVMQLGPNHVRRRNAPRLHEYKSRQQEMCDDAGYDSTDA